MLDVWNEPGQRSTMPATNFSPPLSILAMALLSCSRLPLKPIFDDIAHKSFPGLILLPEKIAYPVRTAALADCNSTKSPSAILDRTNWRPCRLLYCLLLLCGDVQTNPGPSKCQCGLCNKTVRSNQRGIECEECLTWNHLDSIFRKDRSLGGGGVLLAIRSALDPIPCPDLELLANENVWVKILLKGQSHYFCSFYRPLQQPIDEMQSLREQLHLINQSHPPANQPGIHIMGDFNFAKIDWKTHLNTDGNDLSNSDGLALIDIIQDHYMEQLIHFPTRGPNILDLILSNRPGLISACSSPAKLSDHDHDVIACVLNCAPQIKKKAKRKVYLYSKGEYSTLRSDMLKDTFLSSSSTSTSIEEDWALFKDAIQQATDKAIPSKMISGKDQLPWLNSKLRRLIHRKNRLHNKYKRMESNRLLCLWKKARRQLTSALRTAKSNYINKIIGNVNTNPRPFWKYIRSQKKDNQTMPPLKNESGHLITEDRDKADLLNLQFKQNFSDEDVTCIPFHHRAWPPMPEIIISGILQLLNNLETAKAVGPDGIHPRVLKETASEIAPVLKYLFQKSMDTGSLPEDWRTANVCPVYKKGDKSAPINYRPISLTCIICKLMEHIICSNLSSHLELNGILNPKQHAFRRHRSCTTQLCTVIHDWAKSIDAGFQTDVFILDFAKAFDSVPHERLKAKLFHCCVNSNTLRWIDAFLCERRQRVVFNGAKSEWIPVNSGVPQGTVLGPTLFNIFINDITNNINSEIRLFADDCVCYRQIRHKEDHNILGRDIEQLGNWAKRWNMRFEPTKSKIMHITRKTRHKAHHLYSLQNTAIESVTHTKYLGVTVTNDLRWNRHVADVTKKANRMLGQLRRNMSACDPAVKEAAYMGLVRPLLEYACSAWDPYTEQLITEVEKVQRRASVDKWTECPSLTRA